MKMIAWGFRHEHFRAIHSSASWNVVTCGGSIITRRGGLLFLPVAPLPKVDFPTISVAAQEPGVDPQTAASSLAAPLERRFAQIAGVSEITSVSSLGGSSITIQFDLNRDINGAARDAERHQRSIGRIAKRASAAAVLSQSKSIRRAGHGAGDDVGRVAFVASL